MSCIGTGSTIQNLPPPPPPASSLQLPRDMASVMTTMTAKTFISTLGCKKSEIEKFDFWSKLDNWHANLADICKFSSTDKYLLLLKWKREAERGRERQREAEKGRERQREAERGSERQREAERGRERQIETEHLRDRPDTRRNREIIMEANVVKEKHRTNKRERKKEREETKEGKINNIIFYQRLEK